MRFFAFIVAGVLAVTMSFHPSAAVAALKTEAIAYEQGGVKLEGWLAYDDAVKGKRPAVLVVPEWWGHNAYARKRAEQLAEMGYIAFAIDMYGKGVLATKAEEAQKLAGPFYKDRDLMRARAGAGLKVLTDHELTDKTRVAAIGYCMGGTIALELARGGADLKAVVSFHGGLATPTPAAKGVFKPAVLVCTGADDPMVKEAEVAAFQKEMIDAGVDYQVISYGGAVHAFTNPDADKAGVPGVKYNEKADKRSFQAMKDFFGEMFAKK